LQELLNIIHDPEFTVANGRFNLPKTSKALNDISKRLPTLVPEQITVPVKQVIYKKRKNKRNQDPSYLANNTQVLVKLEKIFFVYSYSQHVMCLMADPIKTWNKFRYNKCTIF